MGDYIVIDYKAVAKQQEERAKAAEARIAELETKNGNLWSTVQSKQARIDELMMEFCPGEMSAEQRAEWEKHQRASTQP